MHPLIKLLHRGEDALLVFLLALMIVMSSTQIILRNIFEFGFVWADPLLRILVLWLGLIGATVATRENRHIRIDLLSKLFKRNTHRLIQSVVGGFSAVVCFIIAWHGMTWIQLDYADSVTSFGGIPAWMLEVIVPASFALIGIRFMVMSLCWIQIYFKRLKVHQKEES
jgi:C4-dicarboxylate transporter DctQ subunit